MSAVTYLDLNPPLLLCQITHRTTTQTLDQILVLAPGLELSSRLESRQLAFTPRPDPILFRHDVVLLFVLIRRAIYTPKHEASDRWVLHRWKSRYARSRWDLMELLHALSIAVSVTPPATPEVDALALHLL